MTTRNQDTDEATTRTLDQYDATALVGLKTIVCAGAIERKDTDGETTIEVPKLRELLATVAIARCLMPIQLQGWEIKAMRKIMRLTLAQLAGKLDERTATETVSRWESGQPMGGYAEKILRLLICEELHKEAPGISYSASMIAQLRVVDPWRVNAEYEVPAVCLQLTRVKEQSGEIVDAWDAKMAA